MNKPIRTSLLLGAATFVFACQPGPNGDYVVDGDAVAEAESDFRIAIISSWSAAAGKLYTAPLETAVGIGTNSPLAALHVNSQDDAGLGAGKEGGIIVGRTSNTHQNLLIDGNEIMARRGTGSGTLSLNHEGGTVQMHAGLSASNRFRILDDGKVQIGATNANHANAKLSVDGKVVAQEVVVTVDGFPDFVFADDYRLPSLAEVDSYIDVNNHLPYLPSANEVETEGASLGEINKALLRTVEELTLHMIEQSKQIERQRLAHEHLVAELNAVSREVK